VPSLEFRQFTCLRDGHPLFKPLNFSLNGGEVVQIAGPNGAGKTTFLRSLCGLFDEWTGEMLWQGNSLRVPDFSLRSQLLYLGHQPGVKKSLTAGENLRWFFGVQGVPFPGLVSTALAQVGLDGYEDTLCYQMSAGQLRRVALARLYITNAIIWILDEPFTAIDRFGVQNLETLLQRHVSNGGLVIMTTHQPLAIPGVRLVELQIADRSGSYVD
jgi:heme exporter protein A